MARDDPDTGRRRAYTKADRRGRDQGRARRKNPATGPKECGVRNFAWLPVELLEGAAFRALSPAAVSALVRLMIEHARQGMAANGELQVSHDQFIAFGVTKNLVARAIRELEAAGIVDVRRHGKIAGRNAPNQYALTWLGAWNAQGVREAPRHTWAKRSAADVEAARNRPKPRRGSP